MPWLFHEDFQPAREGAKAHRDAGTAVRGVRAVTTTPWVSPGPPLAGLENSSPNTDGSVCGWVCGFNGTEVRTVMVGRLDGAEKWGVEFPPPTWRTGRVGSLTHLLRQDCSLPE